MKQKIVKWVCILLVIFFSAIILMHFAQKSIDREGGVTNRKYCFILCPICWIFGNK